MVDAARDVRIRDVRTLARREMGKEPVVSIIVAFGFAGEPGEEEILERRIDARRCSEIWIYELVEKGEI